MELDQRPRSPPPLSRTADPSPRSGTGSVTGTDPVDEAARCPIDRVCRRNEPHPLSKGENEVRPYCLRGSEGPYRRRPPRRSVVEAWEKFQRDTWLRTVLERFLESGH